MNRSRNPAVAVLGAIVLLLSGLGFPLTQALIAHRHADRDVSIPSRVSSIGQERA